MELHVKNDEDCFRLLQEGDPAGLQYLIRIYFPVLCRYAIRILNRDASAEDLVEEAIIKLWERREAFTCIEEVKGFLYTSIRNSCINNIRSRKREQARFQAFAQIHEEDTGACIESEIIYAEVLADLRRSVNALPARMRKVFILSHFKEMSNQEIADHLHLSQQTVRNQKTRAFRLIKQWFKHRSAFLWSFFILLFFCK